MSKPLESISLKAPGFLGLNTQQDSVNLNSNYCLKAENLVIDKAGRLAARKGWDYVTTDGVDVNLKGGIAYTDTSGTVHHISWSDTTFYTGCETLTAITPTTTDTINDGNWSVATLNGLDGTHVYFYQEGYLPLVLTYESGSLVFETIVTHTHSTGTPPAGSIVVTAFGRTWVAGVDGDKMTLHFSDLLNGAHWNTGTYGSLNLSSVITEGTDEITGIASHNGYLIIFCKNNIAIFTDTDGFNGSLDITGVTLVDVINGIGCVSQETIQNVGDDLLFLSRTGLRSLGRTIQEKSQPLRDLSINIRDDLINDLDQQDDLLIRSAYSQEYAMYLLLFPATKTIYCFDTRQQLDTGGLRVTRWSKQTHTALCAYEKDIYFFQVQGVAQYRGYQDNDANYNVVYATNFLDFGDASRLKILKKLNITTIGGVGQQLYISPSFDYKDQVDPYIYNLTGSPVYEFNNSEYTVAQFSTGLGTDNTKASVGGAGNVIQIQAIAEITGYSLALQKVDLFIKQGRVI